MLGYQYNCIFSNVSNCALVQISILCKRNETRSVFLSSGPATKKIIKFQLLTYSDTDDKITLYYC